MRAMRVHGGLKIGSLQLDKVKDVIWSGQGEKDLPPNVQALPREGGGSTLQLLSSGQDRPTDGT